MNGLSFVDFWQIKGFASSLVARDNAKTKAAEAATDADNSFTLPRQGENLELSVSDMTEILKELGLEVPFLFMDNNGGFEWAAAAFAAEEAATTDQAKTAEAAIKRQMAEIYLDTLAA